jgi:DNA mismatch repair protein MutL
MTSPTLPGRPLADTSATHSATDTTARDASTRPGSSGSAVGSEAESRSRPGIAKLPDGIAAQIAAGEVIERPASIVKELIENSCDAGASRIQIVIEGSGVERIRISDDGRGMSATELALAFERHATSKLRHVDDLARITSYGFRGEALPSIAAAADVDCLSRAAPSGGGSGSGSEGRSESGARVRFEAGRCLGVVPAGGPPGTTLEVRELFARQPARRKFLAGARAERAAIARVCGEMALAHPEIAVSLEIDGRTLLAAEGRIGVDQAWASEATAVGEADSERALLRQAFAAVWDVETADHAIHFEATRPIADQEAELAGEMRAWGLAAAPSRHRGRRGGVQLFVNRRPVESRRLVYAVEEAYADLLPQRRYPIAAVFLDLPPDRIDVNVHPTKATVKLRDEAAAFGLIQKTLRAALLGLETAQPEPGSTPSTALRERPSPPAPWAEAESGAQQEADSSPAADPAGRFRPRPRPAFDLARGRGSRRLPGLDHGRQQESLADGEPGTSSTAPLAGHELPNLPLLRVVGQLRATFIVAEGPDGMVLLDQHAAHERVVYESLLAKTSVGTAEAGQAQESETQEQGAAGSAARQPLLDPPLLELSAAQAAAWASHDAALAVAGFELEDFGDRSLRLRAIPAAMGERDARASLLAVLDDLAGAVAEPQHHDPVLASTACHASVRAGQTLDIEEMRALLRGLERCDNPQTCPHGRPTLIEFPADDLYRRFGRRGAAPRPGLDAKEGLLDM